jgi:hypothetical protein
MPKVLQTELIRGRLSGMTHMFQCCSEQTHMLQFYSKSKQVADVWGECRANLQAVGKAGRIYA